ncbi:uncharacterized protein AMSG_01149 [Thecamonas trahens ATCC 50062]|uniref:Uncharacterized protein n=1 Tax=Thecamonas trahens ATCC 50062 TaxID=461836 RepID=A0A0L0DJ30_THETB|nr:hypothetical protein AMSG_01149 [Thecamonas trahens ATCC 50062]KNC52317.1 hypothetical protein AMSG_01149 [Thecamonas trahens ATCC 50062]|eukprot:XP_013762313.1 hypothetical protein AMSG_01149 [Thecamonas trahens ATCC 50062]
MHSHTGKIKHTPSKNGTGSTTVGKADVLAKQRVRLRKLRSEVKGLFGELNAVLGLPAKTKTKETLQSAIDTIHPYDLIDLVIDDNHPDLGHIDLSLPPTTSYPSTATNAASGSTAGSGFGADGMLNADAFLPGPLPFPSGAPGSSQDGRSYSQTPEEGPQHTGFAISAIEPLPPFGTTGDMVLGSPLAGLGHISPGDILGAGGLAPAPAENELMDCVATDDDDLSVGLPLMAAPAHAFAGPPAPPSATPASAMAMPPPAPLAPPQPKLHPDLHATRMAPSAQGMPTAGRSRGGGMAGSSAPHARRKSQFSRPRERGRGRGNSGPPRAAAAAAPGRDRAVGAAAERKVLRVGTGKKAKKQSSRTEVLPASARAAPKNGPPRTLRRARSTATAKKKGAITSTVTVATSCAPVASAFDDDDEGDDDDDEKRKIVTSLDAVADSLARVTIADSDSDNSDCDDADLDMHSSDSDSDEAIAFIVRRMAAE